jgi:hypothetical protein
MNHARKVVESKTRRQEYTQESRNRKSPAIFRKKNVANAIWTHRSADFSHPARRFRARSLSARVGDCARPFSCPEQLARFTLSTTVGRKAPAQQPAGDAVTCATLQTTKPGVGKKRMA